MSGRPSLLFLSPVLPAVEGNGLAMRAGVFLEAYARRFDTTLAVLPVASVGFTFADSAFLRRHAHRVEILPLEPLLHPHFRLIARLGDRTERQTAMSQFARPHLCPYDAVAAGEMLRNRIGESRFDALHVERIYMAPLADAVPRPRQAILDLDEDDGATYRSISRLQMQNGEFSDATATIQEAEKLDQLVRDFLPRFDLALVAAPDEAAALGRKFAMARFAVVANAFRAPPGSPASPRPARGTDYLMVGNLTYYPNAEGARFFCREVLPHIRQAGGHARVVVVGRGPGAEVRALAAIPDVSVHTGPADLARFYADAAVALAPIRAGGGSRIKILEAFAHGVPVVSTSIGAAGIEAVDGRHLLIADSPEDFAAAALRLRRDPALATAVAAEGLALFERRYRFEDAAAGIVTLVDSLLAN